MRCQPHGKISPVACGDPRLIVSAHPVQPFLNPRTSLCTPAAQPAFLSHHSSSLPRGPCRRCFFLVSPSSFLLLWGPPPLLHPAFGDSKRRPLAENTSCSVTSKTAWVSGRKSRRSQWCVSRYLWVPGALPGSVPVWHSQEQRGGLGRAEAAAGCHCHFITHLLIVANGDFTAPPALIVSCSSALMEGNGRPA